LKKEKNVPVYLQIARDIAGRIASGEIQEGQRFSGRSLMSSQYSVSTETIRRALGLLTEMDVVSMRPNIGVVAKSRERAAQYVDQHGEVYGMRLLKEELTSLMQRRQELDVQIDKTIQKLTDMAERFRHSDAMQTYEFTIPESALIRGMTIAQSEFRKQTGATILAIRRGADMFISPHPEEKINAGDVLVVVCVPQMISVVSHFVGRAREDLPV